MLRLRSHFGSALARCTGQTLLASIVITSLLLSHTLWAADADKRPVAGFTFVGLPEEPIPEDYNQPGILVTNDTYRELARQTVMIIAREEFGMATRDAILLEPIDSASPIFEIKVEARQRQALMFEVHHDGETLYQSRIKSVLPAIEEYSGLARKLIAEVPEPLAEAFEKAGFTRNPNKKVLPDNNAAGEVPQDVEQQLREMNHLAQLRALRALHRMMREDGESAERLSALCRGYANLTQLMIPAMDSRGVVFAARAMLYAERLANFAPDSPLVPWTKAYVGTLIGMPTLSLDAIKKSDKMLETQPVDSPAWLSLIESYANYRFEDLADHALDSNDPLRELAALLWFRCSMHSDNNALLVETGGRVLEIIPECQFVVDFLSMKAGVGFGHMITAYAPRSQSMQLATYLPTWKALPEAITELAKDGPEEMDQIRRGKIAAALIEVGKEDRQEPSLATLGRNIEAWNIAQAVRRAAFLRHSLSVSAHEEVEALEPLIAKHPMAPVIRMLAVRPGARAIEFADVIGEYKFDATNWYVTRSILQRMPQSTEFANMNVYRAKHFCARQTLNSETTFLETINWRADPRAHKYATWMGPISRNAPIRYAAFMWHQWDKYRDKVDVWLEKRGQHPIVILAAAEGFHEEGDPERALELFEDYLKRAPDYRVFVKVARIQFNVGEDTDDKWQKTMERVFDHPDYGLAHSGAAAIIAATLMSQGKFVEAKPWAERAAQSGSGGGYSRLCECLTALGEFDAAEKIAYRNNLRYGMNHGHDDWYDWCVENSRGQFDKAWQLKRKRLEEKVDEASRDRQLEVAETLHLLFTDEHEAAQTQLTKRLKKKLGAWDSTLLAVLHDKADQAEDRDRVLQNLIDHDWGEEPRPELCYFAPLLLDYASTGKINEKLRQQIFTELGERLGDDKVEVESWDMTADVFLAAMMDKRGDDKGAIEKWSVCARLPRRGWDRSLSCYLLRNAGVDPVHLEGRNFRSQLTKKKLAPKPEKSESPAKKSTP